MTPEMEEILREKIATHLERYVPDSLNDEIKTADMAISEHSRWGYVLNFDMRLPQKAHIFAEARNEVFEQAATELREKLEPQLKKYSESLRSH